MAGDQNISDEAVKKATGKGWAAWMTALDAYGLAIDHAQRARQVSADFPEVGGWWIQMITVEFERRRGLRQLGQSSKGDYQASCSRTVPWSVAECYKRVVATPFLPGADWTEGATWTTKGGVEVEVRRADGASLRWFWVEGGEKSTVTVDFWPKGDAAKRAIRFLHSGLHSEAQRARYRTEWKGALEQITAD